MWCPGRHTVQFSKSRPDIKNAGAENTGESGEATWVYRGSGA